VYAQAMSRRFQAEDLIDAHVVADLLGLSRRNTVSSYQQRYRDMPRPVIDLGRGRPRLWSRPDMERWVKMRRRRSRAGANDPLLGEIVRRLVKVYRPQSVYLFGSHARGTQGSDSDYDLLVVVPDSAPSARRRSRIAYEALWGLPRSGDVVVVTASHFVERAHLPASLPATVLREGKLLFAA
jgi:predicted nucleotidyltransferase